ncbi:MAG: hypothetical protein Q9201_007013 [Fulgogasparrea decipioides]
MACRSRPIYALDNCTITLIDRLKLLISAHPLYGNNAFGWQQREDGTYLFLYFDTEIGTFRMTRGEQHQGPPLLGPAEHRLRKLSTAIMYMDPTQNPCARKVLFHKYTKERKLQTEFRIAKLAASLQARDFVGYLLEMDCIVVQRPYK